MEHIALLPHRFNPQPLLAELAAHPEVWNEYPWRTSNPKSPHREISDIWVRYNSLENFDGDMQKFNSPHVSTWYPVAQKIPSVKTLAEGLLWAVNGEALGGVLITRVPPGCQVYPHVDQGWHAGYYQKVGMQLKGNRDQAFCFEDGSLSAEPGQCYWFDNHVLHWVTNESDEERITLIVTLKRTH